ncbi:MAG: Ribosomal large subunit pseudouridine synthase D [candidate division TA06 bacterium ADurb.Bin417]|uniref:Pseudouridine synthase n=1 Tax=candidate division TA06 bacterium ADurb.Bin417 TaxID=1852828 RepID=A0A1V5MKF4_UNCT6|nr:MAG: Ribosomal large subunit pseudouridine synthase D [candidate division TA06 bacterium ADurb.Bin417]
MLFSGHPIRVRLDKYLSETTGQSRQHIQRLIASGRVLVNGRPARKNQPAGPDDRIEITWPEAEADGLAAENIPLAILYQDADLAVIDKPAGLVTHPYGRVISGTLVNALLYHLSGLSGIGGVRRPGIVHRLDRETSGLMVVAKNDFSHRFLSNEFRSRRVHKKYLAFVKGVIPWKEQEVCLHLNRKRGQGLKIGLDLRGGRESQTRLAVSRRFPRASLVEVFPRTGRTHQIRVVLSFLGFPIIGDRTYGRPQPIDRLIGRQALHAAELSFTHPRSGDKQVFHSPLPEDLAKLAADLTGWNT